MSPLHTWPGELADRFGLSVKDKGNDYVVDDGSYH